MSRFDLVLFDLDGTLVDSLPDIASALNQALGRVGLAPLSLDVVRTLVGEGVLRLAEKALARTGTTTVSAAALADEVVSTYTRRPCVETRLFPGMATTLSSLRAQGARLGVLTNKMGSVARALVHELALTSTFDVVVGDGDGWPRKPAPDAALALAAQLGTTPDRTLMVGDGLPDLAMARAARCPVAAVGWGYTDPAVLRAEAPDHFISAPADLLTLI